MTHLLDAAFKAKGNTLVKLRGGGVEKLVVANEATASACLARHTVAIP